MSSNNIWISLEVPFSVVVASGCITLVLASALSFAIVVSVSSATTKKVANGGVGAAGSITEDEQRQQAELEKSKYPGGTLNIYYATQTGTAESFARELEREASNQGFRTHVLDVESIDVPSLVETSRKDPESGRARAVFVTSTYGEGEAPDSAVQFAGELMERAGCAVLYEKIVESEPNETNKTLLSSLEYCVFGLGNRQYDNFSAMGKFLDHSLEKLGGKRILDIGIGDEDDDLDAHFETWKDSKFWPQMRKLYLPVGVHRNSFNEVNGSSKHSLPDCQYVVKYHQISASTSDVLPELITTVHSSSKHYFTSVDCPVTAVRELRSPNDEGSTVHVEIDISNATDVSYQTADNLGVCPVNEVAVVEAVAQSLSFDLDAVFSLETAPGHEWHGAPFPMPLTVRECLTRYCDLTSPPRRSDLKLLAAYCKDPTDQKALLRMSSKEAREEYREKILDQFVGLVQILKLCPSIGMTLDHFLSICPLLQTRFYTISSSSSLHPNTVHLTVAVTDHKRSSDGTSFKGVCSNYLAKCKPGQDHVKVFNRASTFRLPTDSSIPIILIGPGTGVAPMRALLQERSYQKLQLNQIVGENILYFGCKNRTMDYIYQDELEEFQKSGILSKLRVAFSREQEDKIYVQNLLREDAGELWDLVDRNGAYIYVCGGVKMGQDVSEALKSIFSLHGQKSAEDAKEYLALLNQNGRYVQELWS